MSASFYEDKKHSDRERWICIYPAYINSKKTRAEGRRIPVDKAVENPTHQEMRDVLAASNVKVGVERKIYSRERSKEPVYWGRLRVQLKEEDGTPCHPDIPTREAVMLHLAQMIPQLKSRTQRPAAEQHSGAQASSSKKKGKGRR
ncbi:hypothetical protein B566_EDAN010928 [Ephemera danica]|nr:hypothetical protein B566_EDAN010928 [Ephemera danica]